MSARPEPWPTDALWWPHFEQWMADCHRLLAIALKTLDDAETKTRNTTKE